MNIDELIDDFSYLDNWEDRYGYVLELGRALAPLSEAEQADTARVEGCVSQVWLIIEPGDNGTLVFRGNSDSLIVRGLIAIMFMIYSGHTPEEIVALDPAPILSALGLDQHLTPQRANGLLAMIKRIQAEAQAVLDTA